MALPKGLAWVTGASSGIGWATALRLAHSGWEVAASARNAQALEALAAKHDWIHAYPLDVTDPLAREEVYARLRDAHGPVDALVNNAGYAVRGAVEDVSMSEIRRLYDVNVFAPIALAKLVLPEMRERREGRIINISSVVGKVAMPVNGIYSSTKFALEGWSDAMRAEVKPWGIEVVLIEPGPIETAFRHVAQDRSLRWLKNPRSPYRWIYERFLNTPWFKDHQYWGAASAAEVIRKALEEKTPKARYPVHPVALWLPLLRAHLPTRLFDCLIGWNLGLCRGSEGRPR